MTLLNLFGIGTTVDMMGRNLERVITEDHPVREYAMFGMHGGQVNITKGTPVMRIDAMEDTSGDTAMKGKLGTRLYDPTDERK